MEPSGKNESNISRSSSLEQNATSVDTADEYGTDEGPCGWWAVRPSWIQRWNNPTGYLVVVSVLISAQGMVINGIYNVSIPSLERRFQLTSSQTGFIYSCYDIGYFTMCLFVTYYGNRAHRPMMLTVTSIILGFGCFLFAVPHYTTGLYEYSDNSSALCVSNKTDSCDGLNDRSLDSYRYVFIAAMLLMGMGCTTLLTVGYSVIEDSLPMGEAALHLGIATSMSILGPVLGYVVGAYCLTLYVDFDSVDEIELTIDDPRWVGAWWVGFLFSGAVAWSVTIPMGGFTRQLPGSEKNRLTRDSEAHANSGHEFMNEESFGKSWKDMPIAMWAMLKNPTFTFTSFAGVFESFLVCGYTAFLPKIIQNQFKQTAAKAALYAGVIGIPGGVIGSILSGWIMKRWAMRTPAILKFCAATCAIVFVMNSIMLMHCEETEVSGINTAYNDSSMDGLTTTCNMNCSCQDEFYTPVCGKDEKVYFTACHAGCKIQVAENPDTYSECNCIPGEEQTAVQGICSEECKVLYPFIVLFFCITLMNFLTTTPAVVVTMRCVPESQRSFAMGVTNFIMRGLGCIPGPIVFGLIIDRTCLLWQELSCDQGTGSCWLYASGDLAINLFVIGLVCKASSTTLFLMALYFYKPMAEEDKPALEFDNETFVKEKEIEESANINQSKTVTDTITTLL